MTTQTPNAPAETAPRRAGRLGYLVIGLVVAVCGGGWAVIMANVGQTPGIAAQTITFRVIDDATVEVRWQVAKPTDKRVRCLVDAVDTDFAQVAERQVIVPAGRRTMERTDILRTTRRATAARVKDCRTM